MAELLYRVAPLLLDRAFGNASILRPKGGSPLIDNPAERATILLTPRVPACTIRRDLGCHGAWCCNSRLKWKGKMAVRGSCERSNPRILFPKWLFGVSFTPLATGFGYIAATCPESPILSCLGTDQRSLFMGASGTSIPVQHAETLSCLDPTHLTGCPSSHEIPSVMRKL